MQFLEILGDAGTTENITPGDTATGITEIIRAPKSGAYSGMEARAARITGEAQTVHYTEDGTTPTAAAGTNVGHSLIATGEYTIRGKGAVKDFLCIDRVSLSAGTVKVTCYF